MVERRYTILVCLVVALGLALRIAAARGGLWLDEAWSLELVRAAGSPLGVLLHVNHDNNHLLNGLWLQLLGDAAPPLLQRAPSIVAGTMSIGVAAALFRPQGKIAALIAAMLFAVSPIFVTMGSEARGYATMTLALLIAILLVDRWLAGDRGAPIRRGLALCFLFGALSHLTMLFGCLALIGWVYAALWHRSGPLSAARETAGLFAGPAVALAAVFALVLGAAWASPTGFHIGIYQSFRTLLFLRGVIELVGYTIGWPVVSIWLLLPAVILALLARPGWTRQAAFLKLAIIGFPLALAMLQVGNTGHPRYYMLSAVALLMGIAACTGTAIARGGWRRAVAVAAVSAIVAGGLWQDADLIRNQRGDPDPAIAELRRRAPTGAVVLLDRWTGRAMLDAAAAHARYPLRLIAGGCPPARFLFADRWKGETLPATASRCGARWDAIAAARAHGLSGTHWTLYARRF